MDRTNRGLVAGIIAGFAKDVWNLFDYYVLHITHIRFLDWASVLATLARPDGVFNTVFFQCIQLVWDGAMGAVFAHLVTTTTSRGVVGKACVYSITCWFIFKVIVNLFRVPVLSGSQPTPGAMSNVFAVIVWGIVLGITLKKLDVKTD